MQWGLLIQEAIWCKVPNSNKIFPGDSMVILHVHDQMVPVLQYEVSGKKPRVNKDVIKLSILSCWNLCYTESTYAVEIGKDFTTFIYYQKNCTTTTINCNSYTVWFHGKRADGGKFSASIIKFVEMLVVALDHANHKEGDIYKQVRHLIAIGKQKPGSDIQLNNLRTTGSDCFLIPSMSYINHRKDNYSNLW